MFLLVLGWIIDVFIGGYIGMNLILLAMAASVPGLIYGIVARKTWQGRVLILISSIGVIALVLTIIAFCLVNAAY